MHVHILFGASGTASLKYMFRETDSSESNQVIGFHDNLVVGPLWNLHKPEGLVNRQNWLIQHLPIVLGDDFFEKSYQEEFMKCVHQVNSVTEETPITIWCTNNASEQAGIRLIMYLLRDQSNPIRILNVKPIFDRLFNTGKYKMDIRSVGEVNPDKLELIYKEAACIDPVNETEKISLMKEWGVLSSSKELLRIWWKNQIKEVPVDYFDDYLYEIVLKVHGKRKQKEFIRAPRIIGEAIGYLNHDVGDQFLEYRLRELVSQGLLEVEGSFKGMPFYSVRAK
ncbi:MULTISPECIES: DUF1835 domain-containing protein [unclassified Bacillus (in: firmicutes)]|uniref:DUF1835 domain-containing protein n=1 Tax=unclassified Bacillus (in: firmicutes) TaxID=185979 RepID=UPI0008EA628F|nr:MULTISPECIES: DUF1835 domain-containing protein [unclassified Bacillus (in: firmicutes)]SFA70899.1 Protein of unknown function [Bacillus sp. UNCCL13]SFQ60906.1 Protein of unknown function [Bacillus sp. cl95]